MYKYLLIFCFLPLASTLNAGPWFQKSDFGGEARHRATAFTIGNMGYMGTGHINAAGAVDYEDFWRYDPSSDSWTQIANYPLGKIFHCASFVIGNKGYVGTGRLTSGSFTKKFYEYDPATNVWTAIADYPGAERRGAVAFVANNKGYVGTGQTGSGYVSDFYSYNPATSSWSAVAALPAAGRTSSVAFAIDNYGYVGTGNTASGSINDFYRYNPASNSWTQMANVGPTFRQEATGFAVNGKGYIGTGDDYSSGNNYEDFWEYDPAMNSWTEIENFDGTARRYLVSFVIGSRAYMGTGTNGTNFRDLWMFDQILSVLGRKMDNVSPVIYPNPVSDYMKIDLGELPDYVLAENISIEIYSSTGSRMLIQQFESESCTMDVSNFSKGWYIYRLCHENEVFHSGKVIVQ